MKRFVRCIITLALIAYVVVGVSWSRYCADDIMCTGIHIEVDDSHGSHFVTANEVARELGSMAKEPSKRRLADIDTDSMERRLNSIDKIEHAECTKLTDGKIDIRVTPMLPVARVFEGNRSYYLNKDGKRISATARYHTDVPVIYGRFDSTICAADLLPLLRYITTDSAWSTMVTCIKVDGPTNVLLVPIIHGHVINLGDLNDIPNKFSRLKRAYCEILPVKGWNYYDTLSVKWKGQIVATRRAKMLHTDISAVDFEAEREAPDVGTMLVADSVLIDDNQSIKTVARAPLPGDTLMKPKTPAVSAPKPSPAAQPKKSSLTQSHN
jgi:cell division protein FtsQ